MKFSAADAMRDPNRLVDRLLAETLLTQLKAAAGDDLMVDSDAVATTRETIRQGVRDILRQAGHRVPDDFAAAPAPDCDLAAMAPEGRA